MIKIYGLYLIISASLACASYSFATSTPYKVEWPVVLFYYSSNEPSTETSRPKGQIDFTTFRLISTGMTRDEVLKLAGPPVENSYGGCLHCSMKWVYYRDDGWIVEVSFNEFGQVANVNSYRL